MEKHIYIYIYVSNMTEFTISGHFHMNIVSETYAMSSKIVYQGNY